MPDGLAFILLEDRCTVAISRGWERIKYELMLNAKSSISKKQH